MTEGTLWSSQPNSEMNYAAHERLIINKSPSLACSNSDIIAEPVGLITADEVAFAGGVYNTANQNYYLYNGQYYWTMSPSSYYNGWAYVSRVNLDGSLHWSYLFSTHGVRPVINLKADTKFIGEGTVNSPFEVAA